MTFSQPDICCQILIVSRVRSLGITKVAELIGTHHRDLNPNYHSERFPETSLEKYLQVHLVL